MCSRFYTNTVDSLPQHTYVTTNNVLISSVRTEQTNALTETTTISKLNDTAETERFTTTGINTITNSQVPTKMFKGDDDPALFVGKNYTTDESDWTTTRDPTPIVTITITEPSEEIYNGYTAENRESIFSDERTDKYDISSTRRSSIDLDKTSLTPSWTDSTDLDGINETTTSNDERAIATDNTRTGAVPPNLIKDNNDNFLENSTRFSGPETITVTAIYDDNSKITGSNADTETTLMAAAIDDQSLDAENAVRGQNVNAENSTGPQSSTTPNPFESFTNYFADHVPSTAVTTQDDRTDPGRVTESLTDQRPAGNVGTAGFPADTTAGAPTAEFTSIRKPDEFPTTTLETIRTTDNGSANDTRTSTENQMHGVFNDVMEATTLGNIETNIAANGNIDTGIETTTTIFKDNVEKNAFTEPIDYGWSDETKGFVDTTTLAVRETTATGVYPLSDSSVGSSTGKGRETTTVDLDESMDSRTISFDEEDELKRNNATAFTTRPSYSSTVGGSTERVGNETIDATTVRPVFDGEPTTFVATSNSLPAPTMKTAETGSVTTANPTENDWRTTTVGNRGGAPTIASGDKSPTTGSASSDDGQTTAVWTGVADNTLTTTTTTTPVSLADAAAVFNVFTTSVEMLVSSLNAENDSMTTETTGKNHHLNTADGSAGDVNDTANESATDRETVLDGTYTTDDDTPTTTEYTVTSNSVQVGDATQKPFDQNQKTDINDSYAIWQTTTTTTATTTTTNVTVTVTADTGQRCRTDTDCDAGHKCVAAKCLPPTGGESRVNNCPPGIITLQCLQGIIYT